VLQQLWPHQTFQSLRWERKPLFEQLEKLIDLLPGRQRGSGTGTGFARSSWHGGREQERKRDAAECKG